MNDDQRRKEMEEGTASQRAADAAGCGAFCELGLYLIELFEDAERFGPIAKYCHG